MIWTKKNCQDFGRSDKKVERISAEDEILLGEQRDPPKYKKFKIATSAEAPFIVKLEFE